MNELEKLDEGLMAEIYSWQPGRILKLFRPGFPLEYAQHESQLTQLAHTAGLPTPAVYEVVTYQERFGLVLEQLSGPTLLAAWLGQLAEPAQVGELLAELHTAVHHITPSAEAELPSQREWLQNNIQDAPNLTPELKEATLALLASLPAGEQLCHGDFHPHNILFTASGEPIIIDWFSAVRGNPLADVARTLLLLEFAQLPADLVTTAGRQALLQSYQTHYLALHPGREKELAQWQWVVAAASFCEDFFAQVPEIEARLRQGLFG